MSALTIPDGFWWYRPPEGPLTIIKVSGGEISFFGNDETFPVEELAEGHLSPVVPPTETELRATGRQFSISPDKIQRYDGPIEVGMRFIWEPDDPRAFALIEVTRLIDRSPDERIIWSKRVRAARAGPTKADDDVWSEEGRFREAVTPWVPWMR